MIVDKVTLEDIEKLPNRLWGGTEVYDSILIVDSLREHDSGWACMLIVGCINREPIEIAASYCDDISWDLSMVIGDDISWDLSMVIGSDPIVSPYRIDCPLKLNGVHFWSRYYKFAVGVALSTTEIKLVPTFNL